MNMETVPPQFDTQLTTILEKHLRENNVNSALDIINENKFSDVLKENCADLIPLVTGYLNSVTSIGNSDVFECCKTLLCIIAQKSRTQDVIYELMNIIDTCTEDFKLINLLPAYAICWSRIPSNRLDTLEWSLNSIFIYIENILDKDEEILENIDSRLIDLCDVFANFSASVLQQIIEERLEFLGRRNKCNILARFIVKLIGKPLGHLDDSNEALTEKLKNVANKLIKTLLKLIGDIFVFLTHFSYSENNALECQTSSLGVMYYFYFIENTLNNGIHVYNPLYVLRQIIYLSANLLMQSNEHLIFKGIHLVNHILDLTIILDEYQLQGDLYKLYFSSLSHIIVFNQSPILRKLTLNIFKKSILKFNNKGRYLLLLNMLPTIQHSGLKGFCCMLYKDILMEAYNGNTQLSFYLRGKRLNCILNMFIKLPAGSESDLIDLADQIISVLNVLRFITIRDKMNISGIWNYIHEVQQVFLIPLREGLKMSRAHYDMKLHELYKNPSNNNLKTSNLEISVGNGKLPKLSIENQIAAVKSSLNGFDVMESLLTYLEESIEAHKNI